MALARQPPLGSMTQPASGRAEGAVTAPAPHLPPLESIPQPAAIQIDLTQLQTCATAPAPAEAVAAGVRTDAAEPEAAAKLGTASEATRRATRTALRGSDETRFGRAGTLEMMVRDTRTKGAVSAIYLLR
jgi:hypothetical protein